MFQHDVTLQPGEALQSSKDSEMLVGVPCNNFYSNLTERWAILELEALSLSRTAERSREGGNGEDLLKDPSTSFSRSVLMRLVCTLPGVLELLAIVWV